MSVFDILKSKETRFIESLSKGNAAEQSELLSSMTIAEKYNVSQIIAGHTLEQQELDAVIALNEFHNEVIGSLSGRGKEGRASVKTFFDTLPMKAKDLAITPQEMEITPYLVKVELAKGGAFPSLFIHSPHLADNRITELALKSPDFNINTEPFNESEIEHLAEPVLIELAENGRFLDVLSQSDSARVRQTVAHNVRKNISSEITTDSQRHDFSFSQTSRLDGHRLYNEHKLALLDQWHKKLGRLSDPDLYPTIENVRAPEDIILAAIQQDLLSLDYIQNNGVYPTEELRELDIATYQGITPQITKREQSAPVMRAMIDFKADAFYFINPEKIDKSIIDYMKVAIDEDPVANKRLDVYLSDLYGHDFRHSDSLNLSAISIYQQESPQEEYIDSMDYSPSA